MRRVRGFQPDINEEVPGKWLELGLSQDGGPHLQVEMIYPLVMSK